MEMYEDFDSIFRNYWGLDFGTYRSMLAYISNDQDPKVPSYKEACLGGIPSLFWYDKNGNEFVGDQVQARGGELIDPAGICSSVKTKLEKKKLYYTENFFQQEKLHLRLLKGY